MTWFMSVQPRPRRNARVHVRHMTWFMSVQPRPRRNARVHVRHMTWFRSVQPRPRRNARVQVRHVTWFRSVHPRPRRYTLVPQLTRVQDLLAVNVTSQSQADRANRNAYRYSVVILVLFICK